MTKQKQVGDKGETLAEKYLRKKGYKILERNFQSYFGEIDIIAQDKGQIVFVEVKTKTGTGFGLPEEEFGFLKQKRLFRAIQSWIWKNKLKNENWRVDLIVINLSKDLKNSEIRHYEYVDLPNF